jgi:hypothetical protein
LARVVMSVDHPNPITGPTTMICRGQLQGSPHGR